MRIGLALPAHLSAIFAAEADRYGHEVGFVVADRIALTLELDEHPIDALLVGASNDLLDEALLAQTDRLGIRIVTITVDSRDRTAGRLGLAPVPAAADWRMVETALADAASPARARPDRGALVAVWGPEGAPGRTVTAIALAAALGADDAGVALVDADSRAASIALALGMLDESPGIAAACRLASMGALTAEELSRLSQALPADGGSVDVLTGIARADRWPELSADRMGDTLGACRRWRRTTVVDTAAGIERDEELISDERAPRRNAATLTALEVADLVVLVGTADPIGVARMIEAAARLPECTSAPVLPVVTRVRSAAVGGFDGRAQVVATLDRFGGIRNPTLVPLDQPAADRALRTGQPLPVAASRSRAAAAYRRLASTVRETLDDNASVAAPRR